MENNKYEVVVIYKNGFGFVCDLREYIGAEQLLDNSGEFAWVFNARKDAGMKFEILLDTEKSITIRQDSLPKLKVAQDGGCLGIRLARGNTPLPVEQVKVINQ